MHIDGFIEHEYSIDIDDKDDTVRKYYLNDEPIEIIDPSLISVGSLIYYDKNNQNYGIVIAVRKDKYFTLFDTLNMKTNVEHEVAHFRVYRNS